jgi:hypothetical protein
LVTNFGLVLHRANHRHRRGTVKDERLFEKSTSDYCAVFESGGFQFLVGHGASYFAYPQRSRLATDVPTAFGPADVRGLEFEIAATFVVKQTSN